MKKRHLFNKRWFKNNLFFVLGLGIITSGAFVVWISTLKLPDFKMFTERKIESSTKIYDRTGQILLYDIHQNIRRTVIPDEQIGVNIKNATVAIEDSEFYKHKGIRITSIIRGTIWAKLTGKKVQGGSTITQQLIKNTLLTPEVTLTRKVKEWILAIKLEHVMTKDQILDLYLNEAPYGGDIYGIEEASKAFFGKEPVNLTLAEAAFLAAIPNGPTYYSPYGKHVDKLEERKNLVLKRMLDIKFITQSDYDKAMSEKVTFMPEKPMNIAAPHFVFFVKNYLENKYGDNELENGGLKVITTIDYNLQKKAEEIAKEKALENEKTRNGSNDAIVVIDPKTGQILAMVGSRDYFDRSIDGNFNVTTAARQPGSSFKPIVYADAFEKGYTADTTLFDVKTEFNSSCGPNSVPLPGHSNATCYSPSDFDNNFRGPMTLRDALAQSINIVAVKLLYLVGVNDAIKTASDLGITTLTDPSRYGLSLVIGGGETTLLEMTSAYGVFASNGIRHPYKSILSVEDGDGKMLEQYQDNPYQVLSSNTTNILSDILSDNKARTPTFGPNSVLNIPGREVAVKTGTTNDDKDAWTIGYTPSVVVGVWTGNNNNTPMTGGGVTVAGPIWNAVMTEALKDKPVEYFEKPEPINPSIPAILRGFWQGAETFIKSNTIYNNMTGQPIKSIPEEVSVTNVHNILYWINKNDPLSSDLTPKTNDPLYNNWEYGVQNWWAQNKSKYSYVTEADKQMEATTDFSSAPVFTISGLVPGYTYKNSDTVSFTINPSKKNSVKNIDVFINNTFLRSIKTAPFNVSFIPRNIPDIGTTNTIHVVGYDMNGESSTVDATINVNNQ